MDGMLFHDDELTAQQRAGVHPSAAGIRHFMPEQHRDFFARLPYLFVAVPDPSGWPLATILTGAGEFVHAPSPTTLWIDGLPPASDPAARGFVAGNEIGILGLDLATRRRNRANGRIATVDQHGFSIQVDQSFGNCAQYIQARTIRAARQTEIGARADGTIAIDGLDGDARRLVGSSDTFFVASRSRPDVGREGGLDMSHRGGRPGFVRVEGSTIFIPDFKGNRFFNTLGNFLGDPRAGLLFIDFETGDLLHAAGTVTIDWDGDPPVQPSGAQRVWRVDITRSWWRRAVVPYVWDFGDYARTTLATGVW